jgi:tetratricopeptide (TPR) repeat protein
MQYPDMTDDLRRAATLLAERRYVEAIYAYRAICESQPQHAAIAASQVGAAYFFLKQYARAIEWYRYSGQLGCDPRMVSDNVGEAEQALARYAPAVGDVMLADTGEVYELGADGQWYPRARQP